PVFLSGLGFGFVFRLFVFVSSFCSSVYSIPPCSKVLPFSAPLRLRGKFWRWFYRLPLYRCTGTTLRLSYAYRLFYSRAQKSMQMTARSQKARAFFEEGLAKMETLHIQAGLQNWRNATQADPNFALAHIFLAYFAQDPAEQVAEREKALASRHSGGREEQLIID